MISIADGEAFFLILTYLPHRWQKHWSSRTLTCYNTGMKIVNPPKRGWCYSMDLSEKSQANVEYMIEQIKTKLRMATGAAMQASAFSVNQYDDIYDLYDMVMNKQNLSISEVEAVVSELGQLRGNQ